MGNVVVVIAPVHILIFSDALQSFLRVLLFFATSLHSLSIKLFSPDKQAYPFLVFKPWPFDSPPYSILELDR